MRSARSSAATRVMASMGSDCRGCDWTRGAVSDASERSWARSASTGFSRKAATMCTVPPDAPANSAACRTARAPEREAEAPTTMLSNIGQDSVHLHLLAGSRTERDGAFRAVRGGNSGHAALGGHQDGHVGRGRQLRSDTLGEAGTPQAAAIEPDDDQVGAEGASRFDDAAHQLLIALAPGGAADRELVRPLSPPLADVSDDVPSSPVRLFGQLDEPQLRVEVPSPIAGKHERGACGIGAIERHEDLSEHLRLLPGLSASATYVIDRRPTRPPLPANDQTLAKSRTNNSAN